MKLIKNPNAKRLLANFSYLSIIEIIGLLLPLVSYPYLIRTVGANNYGIVVFAQAIVAYIMIIVNFGFNVSATRRVSESRDNLFELNTIYSSVVYLKIILLFLCCIFLWPILTVIHYENSIIIVGLLGLCIQEVLFPTWLYQGLEKMKFITIILFLSKCTFLGLIFIFIHNEGDYIYIPFLYSFGGVLTSILSILTLKYKFNINFTKVTFRQLKKDFLESLPFFASRLSSVVMERSNVIAIGSFFSYDMVAIYDLCTKVVSLLKTPYSLIAQVVYPNVAKSKDMRIIKKVCKPLIISSLCASLLVMVVAKYIVLFLGGNGLSSSIPILRLMIWYVPIVGISYLFGASVLVVKGYAKEYNLSVVYSVIIYMVLLSYLVVFHKVGLVTMTIAFLLPEFFVASYRVYISYKYKLLN